MIGLRQYLPAFLWHGSFEIDFEIRGNRANPQRLGLTQMRVMPPVLFDVLFVYLSQQLCRSGGR